MRLQGLERCLDETVTGRRKADAARLVDMAVEEERRHTEGGGKAVIVGGTAIGQKTGQRQHLVGIGRARGTADGAAGFRRDINQIGARAGRRAFAKIEAETQLVEDKKLEESYQFTGKHWLVEVLDQQS